MSLITRDLGVAADVIRRGGLVAMPTETVYGLAADAANPEAVARVFVVKGRPTDHPLIVHIADVDDLERWAIELTSAARHLAATAWPGPLTLIVHRSEAIALEVTGGRDTVGIRVPAHPMALELIRSSGTALAAPSANRFGSVSPTTAEHVVADLGELLDPSRDVVLDGGPCSIGIESTIIDTTVDPPQLLRAGGIPAENVRTLLSDVPGGHGGRAGDLSNVLAPAAGPSRASGMLPSHYAPTCEVRLVEHPDDALALRAGTPGAEILDLTHDVAVYARDLYALLRRADADGVRVLIAVLPPPSGLGLAVRDRLTKAAAPRPTD